MLESISLEALDEVIGGSRCGGCGCGCDPNGATSDSVRNVATGTATRTKPLAWRNAFRRSVMPKLAPQAEPEAT